MRAPHDQVAPVFAAIALVALAAPTSAVGQKMYKCSDGKGGTVFQQEKCGETADENEARKKEKARADAEAKRRQEEEARKLEESRQKALERDRAYQEQLSKKAEEAKKIEAAEQRFLQGTAKEQGFDDGSLPPGFDKSHPGAWKDVPNPDITATLEKSRTPGCGQYRYRQRAGGMPEYVVQCTKDKKNWVTFFVWPRSDTVKGPAKF